MWFGESETQWLKRVSREMEQHGQLRDLWIEGWGHILVMGAALEVFRAGARLDQIPEGANSHALLCVLNVITPPSPPVLSFPSNVFLIIANRTNKGKGSSGVGENGIGLAVGDWWAYP